MDVKLRVQVIERDASSGCGEVRVDLHEIDIAPRLPVQAFLCERRLIWDAAAETWAADTWAAETWAADTWAAKHTEFDFGHIEPTATSGRVMKFEAIRQTSGLFGWEGSIERCRVVGGEIVEHNHNDVYIMGRAYRPGNSWAVTGNSLLGMTHLAHFGLADGVEYIVCH
jgi:hypothetical protein